MFVCDACGKAYSDFARHRQECRPCLLPAPPKEAERTPSPSSMMEFGRAFEDGLREDTAGDLLDLRFQRGFDAPDVAMTKDFTQRRVDDILLRRRRSSLNST